MPADEDAWLAKNGAYMNRRLIKGCENKMENKTIMQFFEWYLPANSLHWKRCSAQAKALKEAGIDTVWLPPAYKGAGGSASVGYDVYDTYDLGEFDQKGSVATKYGTKDAYLQAVRDLQEQGISVLADIVLNQMMGADETEEVMVEEVAADNREKEIREDIRIRAWTKFNFPGRNGKYSDFCWNASNFSGTDWDEAGKRTGIFKFQGKEWHKETDREKANYDYLMGVDLDMDCPETAAAVETWGKWYLDTVHMDGFRLDAVKHIDFNFYREWIKKMREHTGKEMFTVGEYWSADLPRLLHYLDVVENSISLFDVPLHFAFQTAATSQGGFDMGSIFNNSLVRARPECAVTFVDNHDTQPGQALASFVPEWFKPIAYAFILLRQEGVPCVFYGDYYGIPHDGISPMAGLKTLLRLRRDYAYGQQRDYLDDSSVVGFTRAGDEEHPDSGMAVLMTDAAAGSKRMLVGKHFAGTRFFDGMRRCSQPVVIDENGEGEFQVNGGSVSVWIPEKAYEKIYVQVE